MWSSFWWISELNDVWTSHVFKTRSTFEGVDWNKQNGFIQKDVSVCFCCRKQISKRQVKSNGWMFIRPWHWLLCFLTRCDFRSSTYEKSTLLGDFRNIFNMLSFAELMRLPPNANVIGHSVSILFSNLWFHLYIYIYSSYSFQCYCFWMNISQEIWFTNTFTHRLEKINICSRPIFGNPQNSEDVFPQSESSRSRNSTLNDEVHGVFSFMQYEGTVFTQWHFLLGFLVTKLALNIVSKKNNT